MALSPAQIRAGLRAQIARDTLRYKRQVENPLSRLTQREADARLAVLDAAVALTYEAEASRAPSLFDPLTVVGAPAAPAPPKENR